MARYLIHLAGDVHQPLHSVLMFNSLHKTGDAGGISKFSLGNNVNITLRDGKKTNLHSYMDSMAA